jgi:hypothetical protein
VANRTVIHRRTAADLWAIDSTAGFHRYAIEHAIERYQAWCAQRGLPLGSVLAIGANRREAQAFVEHSFDSIRLTGLLEADAELRALVDEDPRVVYERHNAERLGVASSSYDLVFCKESLHHLARPVLGFYEMLRICRQAAIVIEPFDTQLELALARLGWSTVYERNQSGNLKLRDNYVYRWSRKSLEALLNGLYLESGYTLELTLGWMSSRFNGHPNVMVRRFAAITGWLLGFVPGSRGNYMTALISPGSNLPPDPDAVVPPRAELD